MLVRVLVVGSLLAGCNPTGFECVADDQCVTPVAVGACEPDGWCSFPDDACPSGDRYGAHAGDDKGGACVGLGESSGIAETSTASMSSADPSTTSTTASSTDPSSTDPSSTDPSSTDPSSTDPSSTDPSSTDPGSTSAVTSATSEDSSESGDPGCGNDCPPYATCGEGVDCPDGACVSIGDGPGTCFPSCPMMGCPDGGFCAKSFNGCALPCNGDVDCPDGMFCTDLPAGEQGCMW